MTLYIYIYIHMYIYIFNINQPIFHECLYLFYHFFLNIPLCSINMFIIVSPINMVHPIHSVPIKSQHEGVPRSASAFSMAPATAMRCRRSCRQRCSNWAWTRQRAPRRPLKGNSTLDGLDGLDVLDGGGFKFNMAH